MKAIALATNNLTQNQGLSKIRKFNKKNIFFQIIFFFKKGVKTPLNRRMSKSTVDTYKSLQKKFQKPVNND